MGGDMKMKVVLWVVMMAAFGHGLCGAQAPHGIGGFVLGTDISQYQQLLNMASDLPIRHMEYIREVEIRHMQGFKSGLIHYGACAEPGKIVRIKLKYDDSSKKFYGMLLERYKQRFGEPSEWLGDPFHIVIAWKWAFVDEHRNRISLVLQHNTKDVEEKLGNSVKLAMTNWIEKERDCFEQTKAAPDPSEKAGHPIRARDTVDWDRFIPE